MWRQVGGLEPLLQDHDVVILVASAIPVPQLVLDRLEPPPQQQVPLALSQLPLNLLRQLVRHAQSLRTRERCTFASRAEYATDNHTTKRGGAL